MQTTTFIPGIYGMLIMSTDKNNQPTYEIIGSKSDSTEDGEYVFSLNLDTIKRLPSDVPVYASVHEFEDHGIDNVINNQTIRKYYGDFTNYQDLLDAANELLDEYDCPQTIDNQDYIIENALTVCDWQSICGYIWNELEQTLDFKDLPDQSI